MGSAANLNFLDGLDVFETWGIAIEIGHAQFLLPHEPKERLIKSWADQHGSDVYLAPVFLKEKEVTLRCFTVLGSLEEFNQQYHAFIEKLQEPIWHTWHVVNHNKDYSFYYKGMKNGEKASRNFLVGTVVYQFDLVLGVQPFLIPALSKETKVWLNGVLNGTYPYGTENIYLTTAGGGVTPTVNITAVNVANNTITVTAAAAAGYEIQYSAVEVLNGIPIRTPQYQSSNVFENVANGKYSIKVRLVGTNAVDTWEQTITIAYTAPAPSESVKIDNVTIDKNTITVLATPYNTNKAVEYSLDGANYQSSNVLAAANGSYSQIKARLVGTTITDTWGQTVTVNYVPVVSNYNTVLLPGQRSGSITYQGAPGTEFHFNAQPAGTFPMSMLLYFGATPLGKVDFNPENTGQPCAIKYNGTLYNIEGGFQDDMVSVS